MYNHQLDTFIQVADLGSFSKAAERLYISPTAVIKQINLLEHDLGLQLFERTHRGVTLTDAGQSLYKDAKYLVQYSKDSLARAQKAVRTDSKTIRLGTSLMTPSKFLTDMWPQVEPYCPDLKITLVPFENTPENAREILQNLGQNIDVVAGIYDKYILENHKFSSLLIKRAPVCCAVSIHHPLAVKDRLKIHDLYGEELLLLRRGYYMYIDALRDYLWENHPQIKITDFQFYDLGVFNQCENSNQILMAMENWADVHPLLKVLPVDWDFSIPYGLLHSSTPSSTVQRFLKAVQQALQLKEEKI